MGTANKHTWGRQIDALKFSERRNKKTTSSLVQHVMVTGHFVNFGDTRALANIEHLRTTREAIEKRPHGLNRRNDKLVMSDYDQFNKVQQQEVNLKKPMKR